MSHPPLATTAQPTAPPASHAAAPPLATKPRGNPDLHLAPRCGARTRANCPCRSPAIRGKLRCRMHGGRSTGPRTPEGLARLRTARTIHGAYSAATRAHNRHDLTELRRGRVVDAAKRCLDRLPPDLAARLMQMPRELLSSPWPTGGLTPAQDRAVLRAEADAPRALAGGDRAGRAGGIGGQGAAGRRPPPRRIGKSPCTSAAPRRPCGGTGCGGQRAPGQRAPECCPKTPCTRVLLRRGQRRLGRITRRSGGDVCKTPCTRTRRCPACVTGPSGGSAVKTSCTRPYPGPPRRRPGCGAHPAWRPDATACKSPCTRTRGRALRRRPGRRHPRRAARHAWRSDASSGKSPCTRRRGTRTRGTRTRGTRTRHGGVRRHPAHACPTARRAGAGRACNGACTRPLPHSPAHDMPSDSRSLSICRTAAAPLPGVWRAATPRDFSACSARTA